MKKLAIITLSLVCAISAHAQSLEYESYHYGIIGGSRKTDLQLHDVSNDTTLVSSEQITYFGISMGGFYGFAELGDFQTGMDINFDMAFGKTRKTIDEYGNESPSMPFMYLAANVLAKIYFGESDDAVFFAGIGPQVSYQMTSKISPLQYGPQIEVGRQFLIADFPVSLSAYFGYGLNTPSKKFYNDSYYGVKSFSQNTFGAKVSFAMW